LIVISHRSWAGFGALAIVTVLACGEMGPTDDLPELARQLDRWARARPASYSFELRRHCFCAPAGLGPVLVVVDGDVVVGRTYVSGGGPVPGGVADAFPSIEGLFALLADAYERDAHRVDVSYQAVTGAPLEIWIDYDEAVADEEVGFSVGEAVAIAPS
jgi:hypothetical protein